MSVDVSQLKGLNKSLNNISDKAMLRKITVDLGANFNRMVTRATPVDSGQLRNAWKLGEVTNSSGRYNVVVSNDTSYAIYVEYGHRTPNHDGWVEGQHFVQKSADAFNSGNTISKIVKRAIGGLEEHDK